MTEAYRLDEEQVLSALIAAESTQGAFAPVFCKKLLETAPPDAYLKASHTSIAKGIQKTLLAKQPVNAQTVIDNIPASHDVKSHEVYSLASKGLMVSSSAAEWHAENIRVRYVFRRIAAPAARIVSSAETIFQEVAPDQDAPSKALAAISREIKIAASALAVSAPQTYVDDIDEAVNAIRPHEGVPSHLNWLTNSNHGYRAGELIVIAARPGVGKSIFGVEAFLHAARAGYNPLYFTLEMGYEEVWQRCISNVSGVNIGAIRSGTLSEAQWARVREATDGVEGLPGLKEYPGKIISPPTLTVDKIVHTVRDASHRMASETGEQGYSSGHGIVIVDYLGLMKLPGGQSQWQELDALTRDLKSAARDLKVPIIVLAQAGREVDEGGAPALKSLRGAAGIEANADIVIVLTRDTSMPSAEHGSETKGHVLKNRNGSTGVMPLRVWGQWSRLQDDEHQL